jgi:hypothetical protein
VIPDQRAIDWILIIILTPIKEPHNTLNPPKVMLQMRWQSLAGRIAPDASDAPCPNLAQGRRTRRRSISGSYRGVNRVRR